MMHSVRDAGGTELTSCGTFWGRGMEGCQARTARWAGQGREVKGRRGLNKGRARSLVPEISGLSCSRYVPTVSSREGRGREGGRIVVQSYFPVDTEAKCR